LEWTVEAAIVLADCLRIKVRTDTADFTDMRTAGLRYDEMRDDGQPKKESA